MRICFFTENYYKGGLDTFIINLINSWPDPEDELSLICNSSHPGLETISKQLKPLARIERYNRFFSRKIVNGFTESVFFRYKPVRSFFVIVYRILQYPVLLPWYILSLRSYFRESDYDRLMVINGGYPASLLCRCAAIAWKLSGKDRLAIFNFHNSTVTPSWYTAPFENFIDRQVINASAQVISVSKACLSTLNLRKAFIGSDKLRVIYNGINPPPVPSDLAGTTASKRDYILMLATYEARKGHIYLLRALKQIAKEFPELKLRIFGYGKPKEKKRVADEVERLGLQDRVELNDFTTDIASLISNAAILVVPSQEYESFGLTIIEAMAFGTPIVTTDVGGMPEVMAESDAGLVSDKRSSASFAEAMLQILRNPETAEMMRRNGKIAFEKKFRSDVMSAQYESVIKL